jgi:hypothetical protein
VANLLTCDAANRGEIGEPVDLFGVGEVHGRNLIAYIEIDETELEQALTSGLTLEAEGLRTGYGPSRLLLREVDAGDAELLRQKLLWELRHFPAGNWRLSVRIAGDEVAHRIVAVGEY